MATELRRKVFLTGASSGIGLAIARLLTERGCEVWGTSRDHKRLPELPGFHPVVMDLGNRKSIHAAFPRDVLFEVLINNAGAAVFGPLESLTDDDIAAQMQLLLLAPLELIQFVLPDMHARSRGLIINITSLAAQFPVPFMSPYNAVKAALSSATQCLRLELADTPIRVVEIRPGDIDTAFHSATKRVEGSDQRRTLSAWETQFRNMAAAPPPEAVASVVLRIINSPDPPPVAVAGGLFQAKMAPLAARFLPGRLLEWGLRRYYRI